MASFNVPMTGHGYKDSDGSDLDWLAMIIDHPTNFFSIRMLVYPSNTASSSGCPLSQAGSETPWREN